MKKLLMILMSVFILGGCGTAPKTEDELNIVTTVFPAYDFARAVAGEKAKITLLIPPGSEVHSYEPTPKDMVSVENADVFIYNGGESDTWAENILKDSAGDKTISVKMTDCVENLFASEHTEGEHEHEHEFDEHVWTSPKNAEAIVSEIKNAIVSADSENAEIYEENAENYCSEIEKLDNEFEEIIKNAKRDTVVFADRFPLTYFAHRYNLKYYTAFAGCSDNAEPGAATVAALINKVKEEEIPAVFSIELSDGRLAETVSKETGAKKFTFNTCHNVTKEDFESGKTYVELMSENLAPLKEALD